MSYNRRTLSPDSPFAILAALLFFAAAAVRTVGFILSYSGEFLLFDLVLELIVPALCCVIFGAMLLSRKKSLIPTVFPIVGGSLYIIFRAVGLELWQTVAVVAIYAVFTIVYILTVTGILNTRRVLMLFCVGVSVLCVVHGSSLTPSRSSVLGILSIIFVLAAVFFESVGMRRGRQY
ncbi:MAG: hypothetical protein IKK74_01725 [Clostridia bacterium]|nr:hypothetical protein [Clostridia bacterium]